MVKQTIPRYIFLSSLAITVVIFVAGLMLGYNLDGLRSADVISELELNELETESYVVEQLFWDSVEGEGCGNVDIRLSIMSQELAELGNNLIAYEQKSLFADEEYQLLARQYFLQEIRAYVLFNSLHDKCNLSQDVILFFFDPEDSESETQGYVLDKVVSHANNTVVVFSINAYFEDNAIDSMELYYNITELPTLIINGDFKQEKYISYSEIKEVLNATFV
ncbi:hypothetical protein HOC80_00375 [archaeon]|jgi:hypothetical protein|nr:hypothetical protein [archaeon]MBT4416540.1 hypothetical protein [archaeon]